MIICTNCGNHNEDSDEFCGSCGKFLEWVGQKVEDPVKVEVAEPEAEPEDAKVGLIDRVKAAVGIEGAAGGGTGLADGAPPVEGIVVEEPVDPAVEAERAKAAAIAEEQERARLEAEAADQAARERKAAEDAERAERERIEAELAAAAALASQQAAEAAAKEAAEQQARREAEAAERERAAAAAREAAAAAERERLEAEAAAMAAAESEAERQRLEAEAKAAAEAAERERLAAEAEAAAAAAAAREAEEQARREAEEAAAKLRAEEEARRAAEAEETRRRAEEERARREAEARAEAARRAAALLAQPKAAPAPEPAASPADVPAAKQGTVAPTAPVAPAPPKRGAPAPPPPAAAAAAATEPARAAMAPSQEPAKPKAPPKPATQVKADEGPKPGDLICDSCGTGNDPTRKFCRRCGNSLAKAEPVKKVPWWKRLFSGGKKKPRGQQGKGKKAVTGARQASFKAEMAMARLRNGVMILAALGLAGGFMVPSIRTTVMNAGRDGINKARDTLFPNFDPIRPVTVTASSEAPDHPAVASADLAINTYWAEGAEGDGVGQVITYTFNEPFELAKILVTPGAIDPNQPDLFLKQPRPKDIHLVFDNGGSADISLKDEVNKAQTFTIKGGKDITKVELSITSVHPGTGGQDTAIAEVEFRKRA